MANSVPPQFFPNALQPITIDESNLREVLGELRSAVRRGTEVIQSKHKLSDDVDKETFGTIFSGSLGIALMFLRLERQAHALSDCDHINGKLDPPLPDFRTFMKEKINPQPLKLKLQPGRPSPLCSQSLGASVIRILAAIPDSDSSILSPIIRDDIAALHEAVEIAIDQDPAIVRNGHSMGGDEVLYGRAGLLSALLNIERHNVDNTTALALQPVLKLKTELKNAITDAGKRQGDEYATVHGQTEALHLMWPWLDNYYGLGAMHGVTGILTVLLSCEASEHDHRALGNAITKLCKICILNNGHLPMSIPPWPSSRPSPFVQICHGTPGLLLLLATAKGNPNLIEYHSSDWDEAARLGSERIWEEGLLSKGGGLCHGIAGNAWPWLLLHERFLEHELRKPTPSYGAESTSDSKHDELSADYFLSRALAFLLAARDTPPFATESRYRMPDNPFSLFEGLAGTICAWSEACVVITARLRLMEVQGREHPQNNCYEDENYAAIRAKILGFPGLGGMGPNGLL